MVDNYVPSSRSRSSCRVWISILRRLWSTCISILCRLLWMLLPRLPSLRRISVLRRLWIVLAANLRYAFSAKLSNARPTEPRIALSTDLWNAISSKLRNTFSAKLPNAFPNRLRYAFSGKLRNGLSWMGCGLPLLTLRSELGQSQYLG
jgi:hypothetical protein